MYHGSSESVPRRIVTRVSSGAGGRDEWAEAHFLFALKAFCAEAWPGTSLQVLMAVKLDQIRSTADRIAASFGLEVVDLELGGAGKSRALRVYLEKDAAGRAKLAELAATEEAAAALPKGIPVEMLSGVTHEDCALFAQDFGTVLDVEDLVPGAEYTLEVSSPGLGRKLSKAADYVRFTGSLVKLQTFTPVNGNRQWRGRLKSFRDEVVALDLAAVKQKGKAKKAATDETIEIALGNIEKANLVAEI